MIGPFTNDFVGGVMAATIIMLFMWLGMFVYMLTRIEREERGAKLPTIEPRPDIDPGDIDAEWRYANRDLESRR